MANVHNGQDEKGIKLFGKTIMLQAREAKDEEKVERQDDDRTVEKRQDKIIPCPRCKSMETKFCYFNNYNVNQPRHFCKGCQRYWTAGGALRNVPVGAGRRKVKPPCRDGVDGFSDQGCVYDASGVNQFNLDHGLVVEEWHVAEAKDGYRQIYPVKRRRNNSVQHEDH